MLLQNENVIVDGEVKVLIPNAVQPFKNACPTIYKYVYIILKIHFQSKVF